MAMDTFEIDLEPADAQGFTVTIPALPGLLIFGTSLDEVLNQTRAAIAWHARGYAGGHLLDRIALVTRDGRAVVPSAEPSAVAPH
jgi:predicted RNase H-like HicB family nuclease